MDYNQILNYYKFKDVRTTDILLKRNRLYNQNSKKYTLQEIANEYGVTKERIRQIEIKGYKKIRASIKYTRNDINEILSSLFENKKYMTGDELYNLLNNSNLYNYIFLTLLVGNSYLKYDIIHGDEVFIFNKDEASNLKELKSSKAYKKPLIPKKKTNTKKDIMSSKPLVKEEIADNNVIVASVSELINSKLESFKESKEIFNVKEVFYKEFEENKDLITKILVSKMNKNLVFISKDICKYYDKYNIEIWEIDELTKLIGGLMRDNNVTILYIDEVYNKAVAFCPDILKKYEIQGSFHFYYFLRLYLKNDYVYKNMYIRK